ncbi:MAG TPA: hypothetical protein VGE97_09425 [Nitrososphaera sp.]
MKSGKKIARGAEKRSIHHNAAILERNKKGIDNPKAFKSPGSRNKKRTGGC